MLAKGCGSRRCHSGRLRPADELLTQQGCGGMGIARLEGFLPSAFPAAMAGAALALLASPANAQRADENAVTSADDAFGSSVGNEQVGLYGPFFARGFSPVQAGNVRIDGLYFDLQAILNNRLIGGVDIRVGISAQSYPFLAPTGIADFKLRKPGKEAILSTFAELGPFDAARFESDAQLPLTEQLSVAAGASVARREFHTGGDDLGIELAIIPRFQPTPDVEIIPFASFSSASGGEAQPIYFTSGSFLPPDIQRRRYFGPSWARGHQTSVNYGLIARGQSDGWAIQAGMFRSVQRSERSFTELGIGTSESGLADRFIAAEGNRQFGSWSGEVRVSRSLRDGPRLHQLHLAVRGRKQQRRYGGGSLIFLGQAPIDEVLEIEEPDFTVGPQTRDFVTQYAAGVGYETRWPDVGELSLGLQRSFYRKAVEPPEGSLPVTRDEPWLMNATAAVHPLPTVSVYAGYARGLEESPVAPAVARNRDEAPPALMTQQMDAGVRVILPLNLRLVAGVFQITKPHFGLDSSRLFRRLGEVRHRGVELSLTGSPVNGLTTVIGTVLMDAELSGAAVEEGLVGKKPIGSLARFTTAALNYQVPFLSGLSVGLSYESTSSRIADRLNIYTIPPRFVVNLSGRYRFRLGQKPASLRAQISNITDSYGWNNFGEGFQYNIPRRFSLGLAVDL